MKRFIVPCILCLCWLMISCSSTPPAEESLPEDVLSPQALEQSSSQLNQEAELVQSDDEAVAPADSDPVQETASLDDFSPVTDEILPLEADLEIAPQDDSQDYLQEIEIIDLIQDQQEPSAYNQENMAVVVEDDLALVVETPSEVNEEIPVPAAAVLEAESAEEAVIVELVQEEGEEAESSVTMTDESVEPVLAETELAESAAPEPETPESETLESLAMDSELTPSEPVDINATQGVLEDFVVPSRSVIMDKEQYLDIRYPGTGWVYLGEVTKDGTSIGTPSLTYFGRRRTSEDTSFTMKSTKPGTTILHFYKQDVLSATFIDDFLEVTITDKIAQNGFRVIAPNYETIVPGYQEVIPQPQDFVTEIAQELPQKVLEEFPQEVSQDTTPKATSAGASSSVASSQQQAVASQNKPVAQSTIATTNTVATTTAPAVRETTTTTTAPMPSESVTASAPQVATTQVAATQVVPAQVATTQVAATQVAPAQAATTATTTPAVPREASPAATVIVPPQTTSQDSVARNSSAQVSTLQQETYQPELATNTPPQDNFNPETGMSMENMDLPWVSQELERQRTADMSTSAADSSQPQAQEMLLDQAQDYFYAEDFPAALDTLNKFFEIAVSDFDAGYYLKGQVLESKSAIKNIKEAQKAYKHVMDSYPQSPFWERAKNRYTYLSRFYFDIR
ncbi:MAG: hypothetical protein IKW26_04700 [Treponema sp.]|nr:hypothetical protein [Treponema sp.]